MNYMEYIHQGTDIDEILNARNSTQVVTITGASITVIAKDRCVVFAEINGINREVTTTTSEIVGYMVRMHELPLATPRIHFLKGGDKMVDVMTSTGTWTVSCDYIAETLGDALADKIVEAMWKDDQDQFTWNPVW